MTLKADLDALTSDANLWHGASSVLKGAESAVSGLQIPEYAFSFAGGEVAHLYEQARAFVEGYLKDGVQHTEGASTTLVKVRDDFSSTDHSQADKYKGIWIPQ